MGCLSASGGRARRAVWQCCSVYGAVGLLAEIDEYIVDGWRCRAAGAGGRVRAWRAGGKIAARQCRAATDAGSDADHPDFCLSGTVGGVFWFRPCAGGIGKHDLCCPADDPQRDAGPARGSAGTARGVCHVRHDSLATLSLYRDPLRQTPDSGGHQPVGAGQPVDGDHCRGDWRF